MLDFMTVVFVVELRAGYFGCHGGVGSLDNMVESQWEWNQLMCSRHFGDG